MGGVLINLDKDACINAFQQIGFTNIEQYIGKYVQNGVFSSFEKGEIDTQTFIRTIQLHIEYSVNDEAIVEAWCAMLLDIPEHKLSLLRRLKKSHRLLMLSNTNVIHFETIKHNYFEKDGYSMHDYFEKCYLSHQLQCAKPDTNIYEIMLRDAGIEPHETLFIDDSADNIATAHELGFHTYLAKEKEDFSHLFVSL